MTSKLAKSQIEKWWSEGLKPTVDDIVLLNNLGISVEKGSEMFAFSACPRIAFLGDNILREPTIAKRLWIDEALRLFAPTVESKIYVLAYAFGTSDDELPSLLKASEVKKSVVKFRDEVLMKFTDTQILAAIEYVMNGIKPDLKIPDDASDEEKKGVEDIEKVFEVPTEDHSIAKQLLLQALAAKIPAECAKYALLEDLEHMIMVAAMHDGANVIKNEHTQAAAKFYMASGRIHERLTKEKENTNGKE